MSAMNSINNIIRKEVNYHDKIIIKCLGPPRPDLSIIQLDAKKGVAFKRKFNRTLYDAANWLCGCDERNAFFCFMCILTNPLQTDPAWTRNGVRDLKHFTEKVKKHAMSLAHIHNEQEFAGLGQPRPIKKPEPIYKILKGNLSGQNIRVSNLCLGQSLGEQLLKEDDIKAEMDAENVYEDFVFENEDPLEDSPSSKSSTHLNSDQKTNGKTQDSELGAAFRKLMETHAEYAGTSGPPLFSLAQTPKDNQAVFGEYIAGKMRQYDRRTQILAENAINEILFKADVGFYSMEENGEN